MNKIGFNVTKESTKIRRRLNRRRRHIVKAKLKKSQDETKVPTYKNTEGWETW
ncbi:MAG TPA: hypothetical protein VJL27_02820 [Patescibacteria group bacterium]|nr:hypothetical protein [Patescibacteria group bacterium]